MAKRAPRTNQADFAFSCTRPPVKRVVRECFSGVARDAIGELQPGAEIFGLTKGQFSLIDLVTELLRQTGPAHVTIATWTAAHSAIRSAFEFIRDGRILSLRWVVDRSFGSRQPEYCQALIESFGPECIRITRTHAKFVVIRNEEWDLAVRTSMNLNHNPRLEDFEISDDPVLADYLDPVTAEIFARQDVGEAMKRDTATVDRVFSEMNTGAEVPSARGGGDGFDLSAGDLA